MSDNLQPADRLKIERYVHFNSESADISRFTALPPERIRTMRGESAAAEQAVFDKLREAAAEWEAQAANTLALDKAIEYVRTPPAKHTANRWEKDENDRRTISNTVYKMTYHVYENTRYDQATQKSVPYAWDLTWGVRTNAPDGYRGERIAGRDRKRYGSMAELEKYLNGRIKAYSHLFTEISPPIPQEYAKSFSVNGQLLPGYTVEGEEPKQIDRAAENGGVSISEPNLNEPRKEQNMNEPLNIQLSNLGQRESGSMGGSWLKLPATAEQLQAALARIGAAGGEQGKDFFITMRETPIHGLTRELVENADIDELNYMAARLKTLDANESQKLNALAHTSYAFESIAQFIDYADNHDFFVYLPDITNNAELGDYYLHRSEMIQMPEEWKGAVNAEVLGTLAAAHERGRFTEPGYILESGDDWRGRYNGREDIPREYRIAPEPNREQTPPAPDRDAAATRAPAVTATAAPFVLVSDNPRDKLKEITGKLEAGIKGIFESGQYKTYLKTLSKFHNYSMNNCLLIAFQKPDATHVAGFNAWRDNFKRQVMKGEKGIKILAPAPFKAKKEVDRLDASGRPVVGRDGKPVREEVEITVPAFKIATVFDVSQTEGEPLPQIGVNELTGSVAGYKEFFAALEKTSPFPIAFEGIRSGAKGFCNYGEKRIAINAGMSELQNLKTAIHEITHARLHNVDKDAPKDGQNRTDQHTREVQAESVAYTVCRHYGLDTSDYSFGYVATWSGDKELDVLKSSLETIRKEAGAIITEIDGHLAELQKSREQTTEQQPGHEEWSEPATPENTPDNPGVPSDDIGAYLPGRTAPTGNGDAPEPGDTFTIYQLKDIDETRDIRFEPLNKLLAAGLVVDPANYDRVYSAPLDNSMTLEKLYFAFNMDRPEDFTGHSLTVSDVVALNKDGKEKAFYVDSRGFQEVPEFFKTAAERAQPAPPPSDLKPVAEYLQKIHDSAMNADPAKTRGAAAFNMAIKRLNQVNERLPETQPQLKALVAHAAASTDIPMLRERMGTVKSEFIGHYAPAAEHTAAQSAPKTEYGANVAAIEAQVKAGQTISLTDLADAIKSDKTAATVPKRQTAKMGTQTAAAQKSAWSMSQSQQAWDRAQDRSAAKPAAKKSTPIHDDLRAGKAALSAQKSAPQRAATQSKNAGLGD
jgi:antirestriction protein ArdC